MIIVNLTPHVLDIETADGEFVRIPVTPGDYEGTKLIARCDEETILLDTVEVDGLPVNLYSTVYGQVELINVMDDPNMTRVGEATPFPEPRNGVLYAVSFMVRDRMPERIDVISPGKLLRAPGGKPMGAKGFATNVRIS